MIGMRRKKENKALNVHCSTQQLIGGYVVKTLNALEGGLKDKERENHFISYQAR